MSEIKTALYGHDSRETAYQVDSYPYGRLRCKIWFWLETSDKKGTRFCSQTENPKNGRMNAHKYSTYSILAGNMYLDENDHVQWACLNEYSEHTLCLTFVQHFPKNPQIDKIRLWADLKVRLYQKAVDKDRNIFGQAFSSESEKERYITDIKGWSKVGVECIAAALSE